METTKDKFILLKKEDKFNLAWDSLMALIPCSKNKPFKINRMAFYKRTYDKETFIICNDNYSHKIVLTKNALKKVFFFYGEYGGEERIRIKSIIKQSKYHINGMPYEKKEINRMVLCDDCAVAEFEYIAALLSKVGCSIKKENKIDNMEISDVKLFVEKVKKTNKISHVYFEFKKFSEGKLHAIIGCPKEINDLFINEYFSNFKNFCLSNDLILLSDLLFFPFYCKAFVDLFKPEYIQDIIDFIKIQCYLL